MTKEQIEMEIKGLEEAEKSVRQSLEPLNRQLDAIISKRRRLENSLSELNVAEDNSIASLIRQYEPHKSGIALHNAINKWGKQYDMYIGGYVTATMQPAFHIGIRKNGSNIDKTIEGLNILLPLLKRDGEGFAFVSIIDDTLSYYHVYTLKYSENAAAIYRDKREEFASDNLRGALEHLQKHHPYK